MQCQRYQPDNRRIRQHPGRCLEALEALSERIAEYNQRIEAIAEQRYPQTALLKQVKGVGTLIALTYMLTLEDPHRFRKSRDGPRLSWEHSGHSEGIPTSQPHRMR
jgi:transposase